MATERTRAIIEVLTAIDGLSDPDAIQEAILGLLDTSEVQVNRAYNEGLEAGFTFWPQHMVEAFRQIGEDVPGIWDHQAKTLRLMHPNYDQSHEFTLPLRPHDVRVTVRHYPDHVPTPRVPS